MPLLAVDEVIARLVAGVPPTEAETVPLDEAGGRILAAPLTARRDQPPFPASAMDGYALRAADAVPGATLRITGRSVAGRRFGGTVAPATAVRIFTGAPIPDGADAVLPQETAEASGDAIIVKTAVPAGRYVRPAGLDFRAGSTLLEAGRRLDPAAVALAAAANEPNLAVRRRPAVAILSLGDELVPPGGNPGPDQIVASAAAGLAPLVAAAGGVARDLGLVRDDAGAIRAAIEAAVRDGADIVVTIGGASVGDHDLVRPALQAAGFALDFWQIAMRPGRPLFSGRLGTTRVLGLPGNPVSALVCGLLFLRPLIGAFLDLPPADPTEPAILGADVGPNDNRQDYLRARLAPGQPPSVTPFPRQDSSMLATLAAADCLLIRAPEAPAGAAGDPCRIIRLR